MTDLLIRMPGRRNSTGKGLWAGESREGAGISPALPEKRMCAVQSKLEGTGWVHI